LNRGRLEGSLTVEAAIVFSMVMIVIGTILVTGIEVYKDSSMTIRKTSVVEKGGVESFRKVELGKSNLETFLKRIKGE